MPLKLFKNFILYLISILITYVYLLIMSPFFFHLCPLHVTLILADDPRCVKQNGNNADPDDCSKFISCTNGTLMAFQRCGDGTLYYPKNDSCEFAHAIVNECGNRRIPDTILIRKRKQHFIR